MIEEKANFNDINEFMLKSISSKLSLPSVISIHNISTSEVINGTFFLSFNYRGTVLYCTLLDFSPRVSLVEYIELSVIKRKSEYDLLRGTNFHRNHKDFIISSLNSKYYLELMNIEKNIHKDQLDIYLSSFFKMHLLNNNTTRYLFENVYDDCINHFFDYLTTELKQKAS